MGVRVPRLFVSVWGAPKTGKSRLALSFPGPIGAIEIGETGIEDLLEMPFLAGKEVVYRSIIMDTLEPTLNDHATLLVKFDTIVHELRDRFAGGGTIVIDSASRLWRSIRFVKTEEAHQESLRTKKNRADFELANDYFEQIIQVVRKNPRVNLVLVHRHRDKYALVPNEAGTLTLQETGVIESRDYRGLENLVPITIQTQHINRYNPKTKQDDRVFSHRIELCRFNAALEGRQFVDLDYDKLVELVFGNAD